MSNLMIVALTMTIGYLLGRVKVKGLSLGTSGILLAALVLGHFGFVVSPDIKNIGLACFVTAVGIIAGPTFFENFKKGALQYIFLGFLTIGIGAAVCVAVIRISGLPTPLALGLLNGALTSTPGLAAALEATGDPIASVGYGIAYPFGVLGVVLFVQVLPTLLKTDVRGEVAELEGIGGAVERRHGGIAVENLGIFSFAIALAVGVWLGGVKIPLGQGATFSLGVSGGPLLTGLLVGHFGHIGPISMETKKSTMETLRELGLAWFLLGAGTEAGQGFVEVVKEQGFVLFIYGALMTLIPMLAVFLIAKKLMKMGTMNTLGSICGGMTSTPALGSLIAVAGSDAVAAAYAATYPIALVCVVLSSQFVALLL